MIDKNERDFETIGTMASLQVTVKKEDMSVSITPDFDNPKGVVMRLTPVNGNVAQAYFYLYLDSAEDGLRFKSLWDDSDSAKLFLRYLVGGRTALSFC